VSTRLRERNCCRSCFLGGRPTFLPWPLFSSLRPMSPRRRALYWSVRFLPFSQPFSFLGVFWKDDFFYRCGWTLSDRSFSSSTSPGWGVPSPFLRQHNRILWSTLLAPPPLHAGSLFSLPSAAFLWIPIGRSLPSGSPPNSLFFFTHPEGTLRMSHLRRLGEQWMYFSQPQAIFSPPGNTFPRRSFLVHCHLPFPHEHVLVD